VIAHQLKGEESLRQNDNAVISLPNSPAVISTLANVPPSSETLNVPRHSRL
jgi:hypothetical protein